MKKNFYNQRIPQLLSWGTVKRSAAAIWLAVVMLLAPAVVHAVDIDLSSPATNNGNYYDIAGAHVYQVATNYIQLSASDSTYVLTNALSSKGIRIIGNNVTVVVTGGVIIPGAGSAGTSGLRVDGTNAKLLLDGTGVIDIGPTSGTCDANRGITVDAGASLTIAKKTSTSTSQLVVRGNIAVNVLAGSTFNINSGDVVLSGNGTDAVNVAANANVNISGGAIQYWGNSGQQVFNVAASGNVTITGGTISDYGSGSAPAQIFKVVDATSKVKITGGSLDPGTYAQFNTVTGGIATNGTDTVRLVTVSGIPATIKSISGYGYNDVTGNPIYLWLPKSAETVTINDGTLDYKGNVTGDWTDVSVGRFVTLAPQGTPSGGPNGTTVAGDPPGWSSCPGDLIPGAQYSGDTYEVEFVFPSYSEDKKVAISVDGDLKDYITVPDTIILRKGQTSLKVPYTVKPVPTDAEGKVITGNIHATVDGAGTPLPISRPFFNQLEENKTVSIDYNPRTTLWTGQVTLTVTNGDKRIYWYSVNGGKSWKKVDKANPVTFDIPAGAEWLYIKAAGSSTYIAFALDTNGNINIPSGLRRQILIPTVADIETIPSAGRHYVVSRQPYPFTVTLKSPLPAGKELDVRTDRENLTKEQDRDIEISADGLSYTVIIKNLQQDVNINILIADGTAAIDGSNVWGANGQLYITSAKAANANIYALTGSLVKSVALTAGETAATSLPAGIYVVTLGGNTYKAVVK
jgi:hypothetical protein